MPPTDRREDPAAAAGSPGRRVPCPTCRQPALFSASNPWRPFCSERCRGIDFGAWATEDYRVRAVESPDEPPADP